MEFHEYANLFPMMSEAEISDLSQDIWKHGQEHAIIIHEGKILDGRNRWKACQLGLIEPKLKDYDGNDALAFVVSCNLHRRQLTPSQLGMIAQEAAQLRRGGFQGNTNAAKTNVAQATFVSGSAESETKTMTDVAAQFDISRDTMIRARRVAEDGAPELIQAVKDGQIPVKAAAQLSKLPIEHQQEVLAKGISEAKKTAAEVRDHGADSVKQHTAAPDASSRQRLPAFVMDDAERLWTIARSNLDKILKNDASRERVLNEVIAYAKKRIANKN